MTPLDIANTAGAVASTVSNIGSAKRQHKRQKELMGIQYENQRKLNTQGQQNAMAMWDHTNYKNQMKHIKAAGLSPGLIYGQTGAGGSTTSGQSGGAAASGSAPMRPHIGIEGIMQAQLTQSQVELNKAQAEKLKADATKTSGVDTELAKVDTELKRLEKTVKSTTQDAEISQIIQQSLKISAEAQSALLNAELDRTSLETRQQQIAQDLINSVLEANKIKANTEQISQSIIQKWKELDIKQFEAEIRAAYPSISQTLGNTMETFIQILENIFNVKPDTRRKID